MKLNIISNMGLIRKNFEQQNKKRETALQSALTKNLMLIRNTMIKKILKDPKTGFVYGNHRASAPGESPASDTGILASSIRTEKKGKGMKTQGYIYAVDYLMDLEYGTSTIEPRPVIYPSFKETEKQRQTNIKEALRTIT